VTAAPALWRVALFTEWFCGACIEQHQIVTCRHVWRDADKQT